MSGGMYDIKRWLSININNTINNNLDIVKPAMACTIKRGEIDAQGEIDNLLN